MIEGQADTDPFVKADPFDPQNRRISIVLLREQAAGADRHRTAARSATLQSRSRPPVPGRRRSWFPRNARLRVRPGRSTDCAPPCKRRACPSIWKGDSPRLDRKGGRKVAERKLPAIVLGGTEQQP